MTKANPINYQLAADLVESGAWRVDAALGLVFGKRGAPFRRLNSWGYVQIKFRDPNDWRVDHAALAHRVIWESIHGPLDCSLTINHIDGDKLNNRITNLEAVTVGENVRHAFSTGLNEAAKGEANGRAVLTADDVLKIYEMAWSGIAQKTIGARFGVGYSIVSNIKHGWAWSHVTGHQRSA